MIAMKMGNKDMIQAGKLQAGTTQLHLRSFPQSIIKAFHASSQPAMSQNGEWWAKQNRIQVYVVRISP